MNYIDELSFDEYEVFVKEAAKTQKTATGENNG